MCTVNYDEVKRDIDSYYNSKLKVERKIENLDEQKKILTTIFGNIEMNFEISDFYVAELIGDVNILKYKTFETTKNKKVEIMVLIKDNKPIFSVKHHERKDKLVTYFEDSYSIYEEDSHYLINRVDITNITSGEFVTSNVKLLNKTDTNIREYYKKEYTFYINDVRIVALKSDSDMYISSEANFENKCIIALKRINNTLARVIDSLENIIVGDKVKEYRIHRKK